MSWDDVARTVETDKSTEWKGERQHGYMDAYERHVGPRAAGIASVLEIGVGSGGSLSLWEALFPSARVLGLDIHPNALNVARGSRTTIELVDAGEPSQLAGVVARHGPFDFIVDDGSHQAADIEAALGVLWPALTPGGAYVVEDMICPAFDERPLRTAVEREAAMLRWPGFLASLLRLLGDLPDVDSVTVHPCQLSRESGAGQCVIFIERAL